LKDILGRLEKIMDKYQKAYTQTHGQYLKNSNMPTKYV